MKQSNELFPMFPYVGGKRWLKEPLNLELIKILNINKNITTYVEPFLGAGGSLYSNLNLLKVYGIKNILINDVSIPICSFYYYFLNNPSKLFDAFQKIEDDFNRTIPTCFHEQKNEKDRIKILLKQSHDFYKEKVEMFNQYKNIFSLETGALFLFIQNHCFNGFYRENKKGHFNASFNWKFIKKKYDFDLIKKHHNIFSHFNVTIKNGDYKELDFQPNQLLYIDPPYINDKKGTESNYNKDKFTYNEMKHLSEKIQNSNNCFLFSHYENSDIYDLFKGCEIKIFERQNTVSGDPTTRNKILREMLVVKI